ncbi:TonB-dependent receptor [Maribacter algarum]|uniref:TonB-dependent receptor n=1 Tax=Maribacter algarum (ex Zhang et al. 2020) TaxID=2578118 RepID=A0A5S3PHC0_9FLAO|nr:TonB-dependent receptor [Maribacter algarum]TMM53680.1 TonB-dependent receptor [Maribacter algarum]
MKNVILLLFTFLGVNLVFGQRDSVIFLQEVVLSDSKLQEFADGIKVTQLNDSVLQRNQGMLTDNLQFNTPIYFRQNGYGMVSSASFRGTSASQTAVVWNGININSQLTGQTDFNTVMAQNLSEVFVRSGGGSTQYGTGAIGGSIHLNQNLAFGSPFENRFRIGYGSFDTNTIGYQSQWGTNKTSFSLGIGHFSSTNNFKYLGTDRRNENGAFSNQNLDIAIGQLLSKSNLLKVYQNTFFGNRDFSGTLTAPSNDNYRDLNTRSLVEWTNFETNYIQRVKAAYLSERYRYYANKEREEFSFGTSGSFLLNYDYLYRYKKWKLNGIIEANTINAQGSSINKESRNRLAGILLISHRPSNNFSYGIDIRKDWVSDFESPFVYSIDIKYEPTESYTINLNTSKNFRIPTFNDLYWEGGGAVGNSELLPETSLQGEIGQTLSGKNYSLSLNGFYISTIDLIQWRPDVSGNWSPINVKDVTHYGLEFETEFLKKSGEHQWQWKNGYAYTKAIDNESKQQLIYVPYHKITSNLAYSYKKWGAFTQGLYNGEVFTSTDNNQNLSAYLVLNAGLTYGFPKKKGIETEVHVVINNLLNENYQNVAFRPMPNRNIHLNLNFKF